MTKVAYSQIYNTTRDKAETFIQGFVMDYVDSHLEGSRDIDDCWSYVQDGINLHEDDFIATLEDDEKQLIKQIPLPRLLYNIMDSRFFGFYLHNKGLSKHFTK